MCSPRLSPFSIARLFFSLKLFVSHLKMCKYVKGTPNQNENIKKLLNFFFYLPFLKVSVALICEDYC